MKLEIFQIYFHDEQLPYLESNFKPYKNLFNFNRLYEQNVIESAAGIAHPDTDIWGFTSWKFRFKTNMQGHQWTDFIMANQDCDAWFMEPISVPYNPYLNAWVHGDAHHPGLMERTEQILGRLGYKLDCHNTPMPLCFFSYYAMRRPVWDLYLQRLAEIRHIIASDPVLNQQMLLDMVQYGDQQIPFYTFFAERFITSFLHEEKVAGRSLRYHNEWFHYGDLPAQDQSSTS